MRKTVLLGTRCIFVLLVSASAQNNNQGNTLTGLWNVTVTDPGGPPPFVAMITFNADGTLMATETDEQRVTQGLWHKAGEHDFSLVTYQFDFEPNFDGTFRLTSKVKLDQNKNHLSGPFHIEFFDTNGNLLFTSDGTLDGTRVTS